MTRHLQTTLLLFLFLHFLRIVSISMISLLYKDLLVRFLRQNNRLR